MLTLLLADASFALGAVAAVMAAHYVRKWIDDRRSAAGAKRRDLIAWTK